MSFFSFFPSNVNTKFKRGVFVGLVIVAPIILAGTNVFMKNRATAQEADVSAEFIELMKNKELRKAFGVPENATLTTEVVNNFQCEIAHDMAIAMAIDSGAIQSGMKQVPEMKAAINDLRNTIKRNMIYLYGEQIKTNPLILAQLLQPCMMYSVDRQEKLDHLLSQQKK